MDMLWGGGIFDDVCDPDNSFEEQALPLADMAISKKRPLQPLMPPIQIKVLKPALDKAAVENVPLQDGNATVPLTYDVAVTNAEAYMSRVEFTLTQFSAAMCDVQHAVRCRVEYNKDFWVKNLDGIRGVQNEEHIAMYITQPDSSKDIIARLANAEERVEG